MLRQVVFNKTFLKKSSVRCVTSSSSNGASQVQPKQEKPKQAIPVMPVRKPKLEPFVKNLFLGKFDTTILDFPVALDKDRHETLHAMVDPIERFFNDEIDSDEMDRNARIPEDIYKRLKELGLYGIQVPEEYGGLGLGSTEFSRLSEIFAIDGGIAVTLAAHQCIGFKGIQLVGSDYLKEKYLPKLASGELTAAFCLTEPGSGSDAGSVQTRATLAEDGKTWLLNGSKVWISNGGTADVMTVFARTEYTDKNGKTVDKVSAFFVERNFGGVTNGKPEDKMGIRASNTAEVYFDNTPVPPENVLGDIGSGFKLAVTILNSGRFSMGASTAGVLKKAIGWTMEHALSRKQFGHALADFGLIKHKFAQAAVCVYAMESMSYLSAAMIDIYEESDTAVEAAIVKVYSSSHGWILGSELLQIMGGLGYMRSYPYERFLRDSRITLIFEGTNEILRMFIALMGIQHAAPHLKDTVKKLRNPFMNPNFALKTALRQLRDSYDTPKSPHDIQGHVHPSLQQGAEQLEYCVERFRYAVQLILTKYGADVIQPNHQMDVVRLADMVIDIYAMSAVLSRSSRSYCDGIHNADHEVLLALTFCNEANDRIKKLFGEVSSVNNDENYTQIANQMVDKAGYAATHPLTFTNW